MVPDDEVGVAVVDLCEVGRLVLLDVGAAPLDVATAAHEGGHGAGGGLRLVLLDL